MINKKKMTKISGITILSYIIAGLVAICSIVYYGKNDLSSLIIALAVSFIIAGMGYLYDRITSFNNFRIAVEDYLAEQKYKDVDNKDEENY